MRTFIKIKREKINTNNNEKLYQIYDKHYTSFITIYKEDSLCYVHILKFQFYPLKYNHLLNF